MCDAVAKGLAVAGLVSHGVRCDGERKAVSSAAAFRVEKLRVLLRWAEFARSGIRLRQLLSCWRLDPGWTMAPAASVRSARLHPLDPANMC